MKLKVKDRARHRSVNYLTELLAGIDYSDCGTILATPTAIETGAVEES